MKEEYFKGISIKDKIYGFSGKVITIERNKNAKMIDTIHIEWEVDE